MCKGPYKSRTSTPTSHIQFYNRGTREDISTHITNTKHRTRRNIKFHTQNIKCQTQYKHRRNYALNDAKQLIGNDPNSNNFPFTVTGTMPTRSVTLNSQVISTQAQTDSHGTFIPPFTHLTLT